MFDSIGWGEIVVLALAALFIFGPERLPDLAKEAASGLKRLRTAITGVRAQVDESLGDDLAGLRDLDLRKYHPKTFLRDQLLADDDGPPVARGTARGNGSGGLAAETAGAGAVTFRKDAVRPRDAGTPPPFDLDAT
ncbi:twin-arginine translocase TatA/TatE family subunit [Trujillonella endophytica]|uniref:Sec-independent protein translocase protein TatB n=1 Tax=Trujillonella endophytica TaxID=673521 RepID=A0A1H8SBC1_9ACTN|nr:twin-arginine translocase TatA/TatE family subunit [Trujillella endophytica]SEO75952.1 sec-independent protein translocase protein TatB [Trujillella endophytica]